MQPRCPGHLVSKVCQYSPTEPLASGRSHKHGKNGFNRHWGAVGGAVGVCASDSLGSGAGGWQGLLRPAAAADTIVHDKTGRAVPFKQT